MKRLTIRQRKISAAVLVMSLLFGLFQNCSKGTHFDALSESYVVDTATRILKVDASVKNEVPVNPLKILLVVDNSATMKNSQNNLNRNLDILLKKIKNSDAEVGVISTDFSGNRNFTTKLTTQNDPVTSAVISQTITPQMLPGYKTPSFKLQKEKSDAENQTTVNLIKNKVTSLGTSGSDNESPIASFAAEMLFTDFFKSNDNALIYFLTDEDDYYSLSNMGLLSVQKSEPVTKRFVNIYFKHVWSYRLKRFAEDHTTIFNAQAWGDFPNQTTCEKDKLEMKKNPMIAEVFPCAVVITKAVA